MAALGSNMKGHTGKPEKEKKKAASGIAKSAKKTSKPAVVTKPKEKKPAAARSKKPVKTVVASSKVKKEVKKKSTASSGPVKVEKPVVNVSTPVDKAVQKESPVDQGVKLRGAQFILEPSKRKKIRKTKVIMEGELNINNVDSFMELINPVFSDYDYVDFFLREVVSLDLSHIQMLYYYQNHHIKKGKTVTVDADLSPDLKNIVVNAGFKELMFIPKLV